MFDNLVGHGFQAVGVVVGPSDQAEGHGLHIDEGIDDTDRGHVECSSVLELVFAVFDQSILVEEVGGEDRCVQATILGGLSAKEVFLVGASTCYILTDTAQTESSSFSVMISGNLTRCQLLCAHEESTDSRVYSLVEPHLRKSPQAPCGGCSRISNCGYVACLRLNSRRQSRQAPFRLIVITLDRGESAINEIESSVHQVGVRETYPKGLVNVEHVDVVVPGMLVQCRRIRIGVDVAREDGGAIERGITRTAAQINRCRGILGIVSRL